MRSLLFSILIALLFSLGISVPSKADPFLGTVGVANGVTIGVGANALPGFTCPSNTNFINATFGTWITLAGACDDGDPNPNNRCNTQFTFYEEGCNVVFGAPVGAIQGFSFVGAGRTCLGPPGSNCAPPLAPGVQVVNTYSNTVRSSTELVGGLATTFHGITDVDQNGGTPFVFNGQTIKAKRGSFTCHTIGQPDNFPFDSCFGENGALGCGFDAVCTTAASATGAK